MSNTKDGGPAFPRPASKGNNYLTGEEDVVVDPQRGMSVRDYFAAHALLVLKDTDWTEHDCLTREAYKIADSMLKMREARQ